MRQKQGLPNQERGDIGQNRIRVEDLDMAGTWDTVSEVEVLARRCRELGLSPEDLLYSGFDLKDLNQVLKTGSYRKESMVFCSTYKNLLFETDVASSPENAMNYANKTQNPGIIAYNPKFLRPALYPFSYEISSNVGVEDLIKVIFRLKYGK